MHHQEKWGFSYSIADNDLRIRRAYPSFVSLTTIKIIKTTTTKRMQSECLHVLMVDPSSLKENLKTQDRWGIYKGHDEGVKKGQVGPVTAS